MSHLLDGPWEAAFYTELPAKLRSKSNYRRGKKGWGALATFEAVTAATLANARPADWNLGDKSKPVNERPTVVLAVIATSLIDSTNFTKSVADAMEGVLVHNDASVATSMTLSERSKSNQRCAVAVAQLPAKASLAEQAKAVGELAAQLPALFNQ